MRMEDDVNKHIKLSNMTGSENIDRIVEILDKKQPPLPLSEKQKEIAEEDFEL